MTITYDLTERLTGAELAAVSAVDNTVLEVGNLAPGEPVFLTPDNPWLPYVNRAGGFGLGSIAATVTTILVGSPYIWWALATTVCTALLFAWVVAGHELFEKRRPTRFKAMP